MQTDERYSTTKLLTTIAPKIVKKPEDKFGTMLFFPPGEGRKGEGGLRTKGYFKHSYKKINGKWYICDNKIVKEEIKGMEWD